MKNTDSEGRNRRVRRPIQQRVPNTQKATQETPELAETTIEKRCDHEILKMDIFDTEITRGGPINSNMVTPAVFRDILVEHIDGSWATKIKRIRQEPDDEKRKKLKADILPYYILATFHQNEDGSYTRSKKTLKKTEIVEVDVDEIPGGEDGVEDAKQKLLEVPAVFAVFRSPSGRLRCMVKLSEPITDADVYTALYKKIAAKIEKMTGLITDPTCTDAARAWYFSHDPDMVIREAPLWDIKQYLKAEKRRSKKRVNQTVKVQIQTKNSSEMKLSDTLIDALLELKQVKLGYSDWHNVLGLALAALLGEAGRDLWIEISTNEFYNDSEDFLNVTYDRLLAAADPGKSSPKVLEKLLKKHEVEFQIPSKTDGSFWVERTKKDGSTYLHFSLYLFNSVTVPNLGFFYDYRTETIGRYLDGNLIQLGVSRSEMKAAIEAFIKSFKDKDEQEILDYLHKHSNMFLPGNLEYLPMVELTMLIDDKDYIYKCHRKGIIRISRKDGSHDQITYDDIGDRHVNVENLMNWDGELSTIEEAESSDYAVFMRHSNADDPARIDHAHCAAAFLCDSYKVRSQAAAIVFQDENIVDQYTPNGGGGKGLTIQGIMEMARPSLELDGKVFHASERFQSQNVLDGHRLVFIDDISRRVKSDSFFPMVTGDYKIEKKGLTAFIIPFSQSPKLVISANHHFPGPGTSNSRRYVIVEIGDYYNETRTPGSESGREFFSDEWSKKDWQDFYSYWILVIFPTYLDKGLNRHMESFSIQRKQMVLQTSEDWMLWAEEFLSPGVQKVPVNNLRDHCMEACGKTTFRKLENHRNLFGTWLRKYVEGYKGWELQRKPSDGDTLITIVELNELGKPIPTTQDAIDVFTYPRSQRGSSSEDHGLDNALTELDNE